MNPMDDAENVQLGSLAPLDVPEPLQMEDEGTSAPISWNAPAGGETLMATASGTTVRIFDAERFLFHTKECKHVISVPPVPDSFSEKNLFEDATCSVCKTEKELWVCLICLKLFCGRFENRHMVEHHRESGHCVSISLADLSSWCFACEMYLDFSNHKNLARYFTLLHQMKFMEKPEGVVDDSPQGVEEEMLFWENLGPMGELLCSHMGGISDEVLAVTNLQARCKTCIENEKKLAAQGRRTHGKGYVGEAGDSSSSDGQSNENGMKKENWICLTCSSVFCGRYNRKHMLLHHKHSGHPLCLSFQDLSIWCYSCIQYVDHTWNPKSRAVYEHFSRLKFGNQPLVLHEQNEETATFLFDNESK